LEASVTLADFSKRLSDGIKAFGGVNPFSGQGLYHPMLPVVPSNEDAADLKEFMRPLLGKRGASLSLKHVRIAHKDGDRETIAEYDFDESELNRAAVNIDDVLFKTDILTTLMPPEVKHHNLRREVMLFFQQASRAPGKEDGRTADKAIVPDVSDKPLPTYFRKGVNDLKRKMVQGDDKPLTKAFIVDIHVQEIGGVPKAYIVTDVHGAVDI
jgi:hypothetical protein